MRAAIPLINVGSQQTFQVDFLPEWTAQVIFQRKTTNPNMSGSVLNTSNRLSHHNYIFK